MAASKVSALTALTSIASGDFIPVVDISDTTQAASGTTKKITQDNLIPDSSDTIKGKVELATTAETTTGTDATRAVTPDGLHDMTSLAGAAWFLDQDAMTDDSSTKVPSQQSVKAYVDTTAATEKADLTKYSNLYAPQGFLINGKISVTDAVGITVAIKTLAGTDPSATDPVYVRIGDTVRTISAALSVAKADGTNWCNAGSAEFATKEIDYFVYLGYNSTDGVVIGFSRFPGANQYSDFSATSTNEKYCAISTITNAASTDYYEVVGRFAATLSAGAGYTWSVPTYTAINLIQRPIYETRYSNYVPTGPTGATITGRYKINRDTVKCMIVGSVTGAMNWTTQPSLPLTVGSGVICASSDAAANGTGGYLDSGTVNNVDGLSPTYAAGSTAVRIVGSDTSAIVTATSPITWANGDTFFVQFTYEI